MALQKIELSVNSMKFRTILVLSVCCVNYLLSTTYIQQANDNYTAGEHADTIAERKKSFNQALSLYLQVEKENHPTYSDGKLYYNIANTYFQLEEYPWAILYYERALKLRPTDEKVHRNLSIALEKAGLPKQKEESIFQKIFFWHSSLSLPQRLQLLFALTVLMLALISAILWKNRPIIKKGIILVGILWALFFFSVIYTHFFAPIEAIAIKPTSLYLGPGPQYAEINNQTILAGSKVRILESLNDGSWLKIISPTGEIGYVSTTNLEVVR